MANLSQEKRFRMLNFLNTIKEEHKEDDEVLKAIYEIENELVSKKYGLVWEKHEENVDVQMRTHIPVFTEVKDKEIVTDKDNSNFNFLLEGDNLHSLKLLEKTHKGKIDLIYIDPPYNTGNKDFKYNDVYVDGEDTFRHSKWLSFMSERLRLAYKLLNDYGVIFISINDSEYATLKMLCDEIFGESNFQITFHMQVRYADKSISTEDKAFKPLMEYVLMYAKNSNKYVPNQETTEYGLEKFNFKITELSKGTPFKVGNQEVVLFRKGEWKIEKVEGTLSGLKETWVTGSIYTTMSYGKVFQSVVEPRVEIDGLGCLYKVLGRGDDGLGYRYYTGPKKKTATKGKMYSGIPLDKAEIFKSGNAPLKKIPIVNCFDYSPDFGNIRSEGGIGFNSGKKPIKMLKQLIKYHSNKDVTVLDFFAGSASTAHAVLDLNREDNGTRKFIICTNNESGICENVTYPRLENVINGYGSYEGIPANLKYYKTGFIPKIQEDENQLVSDSLLNHIKEMVQLEHGISIDNDRYHIILTDEDADRMENEWCRYMNCKVIYISKNVLLTASQNKLFSSVDIKTIPDYYFENELKEVGEIW
ncbi:site-specific DNA-methyltransferase [Clostridium botulinum]|nr:site-specific DNA-methyltransferase [Clostridium botulinum]